MSGVLSLSLASAVNGQIGKASKLRAKALTLFAKATALAEKYASGAPI
jgi:hypothetical protein